MYSVKLVGIVPRRLRRHRLPFARAHQLLRCERPSVRLGHLPVAEWAWVARRVLSGQGVDLDDGDHRAA